MTASINKKAWIQFLKKTIFENEIAICSEENGVRFVEIKKIKPLFKNSTY